MVEFSDGRAAGPFVREGRTDRALEPGSRTGALVGGLTLGRTGAVGLTDVGGTGGRTALGFAVSPIGTPGLDAAADTVGRAGMVAGLETIIEEVVGFAELRAGVGLGRSLLESPVRSTMSRGLPLFLPFEVSAFAEPLIVVSFDRSMTRLAAPEVLIAELVVDFSPCFPILSTVVAGLDLELWGTTLALTTVEIRAIAPVMPPIT